MHIATLLAFEDEMQKIAGLPRGLANVGFHVSPTNAATGIGGAIRSATTSATSAATKLTSGKQMSALHGAMASRAAPGTMRQHAIQQGQRAAAIGGRTGDMAQIRGHGPMQAAPQGNKYLNMQKAKAPAAPARIAA